MNLTDKVAVITGGSGAIGSATAHRLAEAGATVVVGYNSKPDRAESVAAALPGILQQLLSGPTPTDPWVVAFLAALNNA